MKEIKITVEVRNEYAFLKQVSEINRKFDNHGYPHLKVQELNREITKNRGYETGYIYYTVTSKFEKNNLMGIDANFEGTIELLHVGQEESKIFNIENESIKNIIFNEHCVCDKCKKDIARGKYLIFSKTANIKNRNDLVIVGTTCAKSYFPFNVEGYLTRFESYMETLMVYDEDSCGSKSIAEKNVSLGNIAYSTNVITNGLTKTYVKSDINEEGTLSEIKRFYDALIYDNDRRFMEKKFEEQTESVDLEEMISTARDYYNRHSKDNDFCFNCNQFLQYDSIDKKYFGRVASALIFGNLNAKKEKEFIDKRSSTTSYIMEEKEKFQNLELNFDKVISFETQYGTTSMMRFLDNEGHILVWYTQKSSSEISPNARPLNKGDKVYLNGTCKGHKEYRGEKQTLITRCKSAVEPKFVPTTEELATRDNDEKAMKDFFNTMNENC